MREQVSPPSNEVNWSGYGTRALNAECRVLQFPSTKKVIIGQSTARPARPGPLVKFQFNGVVEASGFGLFLTSPDTKLFFQNVGLSNLVAYTIRMSDGLVP